MLIRFCVLSLLVFAPGILSTPAKRNEATEPVTPLDEAQISSYVPYAWLAAAAYCPQGSQATWSCGSCEAPPVKDLVVYASGGDSKFIQNWYVGWWPSGNTVIVTHQGTSLNIVPVLTDASFLPVPIDPVRFPGVPPLTQVHKGFHDEHALTANKVLQAVRQIIAERGANKVTTVGHSLGGALALLDALFLRLNLPAHVQVVTRTFGQPRVGNDIFAQFIDLKVPDKARITLKGDIVPASPPLIASYRHSSGEIHENQHGKYNDCSGRDNLDVNCSTGQILSGSINLTDHLGPYPGGVNMGPAGLTPSSLC
ncbi:Lipase (class 3) [Ceratobasidium sp. AG-Ba]|nr:Lipase (class 3) [Ceratobasidium sp. AG-Ba]